MKESLSSLRNRISYYRLSLVTEASKEQVDTVPGQKIFSLSRISQYCWKPDVC